jgi:hypothetical protein
MGSSDRSFILSTTTPSFGWPVPTSDDLVKNGATAIEALGDAIDSSMTDLKGGTTGQVLSKTSNTDMDFTWVAQDDSNAIQNSIVDAKGDLIAATAADTPARLAVGTNGQVLTADSTAATGLAWATPSSGGSNTFYAGKNKFINGDFGVWQRGTSFAITSATGSFAADRFATYSDFGGGSITVSRQTFAPATAPVAGYEGQYFLRWAQTSTTGAPNPTSGISQNIEDVRTFAGQTVTLSFWAKADASRTVTTAYEQYCGSGGSGYISGSVGSYSVTTSWTRFSTTFTVPSLSGKTLGANSRLQINMSFPLNTTATIDTWGWQLEAGSSATDFVTASGNSPQAELAMCQRYYYRSANDGAFATFATGSAETTTLCTVNVFLPVQMRVNPTSVTWSDLRTSDLANDYGVPSVINFNSFRSNRNVVALNVTDSGYTAFRPMTLDANNSANAFLAFSAEL